MVREKVKLVWMAARIEARRGIGFYSGRYRFQDTSSFPKPKLEQNCELRGTDNIHGKIYEHILAQNRGYCVYYPSNTLPRA